MKMLSKVLAITVIATLFTLPLINLTSGSELETYQGYGAGQGNSGENGDQDGGQGKGPEKGVNDKRRNYEERELSVDRRPKRAVIESNWKNKGMKDQLMMQYSCTNYPRFDVDYQVDDGVSLSFQVIFKKVIEYEENSGNGRFDENDQVVRTSDLQKEGFKNIRYEGDENYRFSSETEAGRFKLVVKGGDSFLENGSEMITPTQAKVDIQIDHGYVSNSSRLALELELKAKKGWSSGRSTFDERNNYSRSESWSWMQKDNYSGYFSWSDFCSVDGNKETVNATVLSKSNISPSEDKGTPSTSLVYLSYPRGEIEHDPKIGVVGISSITEPVVEEKGESFTYLLTVLLVTVSVASVVFASGIYMKKK